MDRVSARCSIGAKARDAPMLLLAYLMRSALWAISATLGGLGVFCVIYSFVAPHLGAQGLILLGAALAIVYFINR
jgi:hypothetical protein